MKNTSFKYIILWSVLIMTLACNKTDNLENSKIANIPEDAIQVDISGNAFYQEAHINTAVSNNFGKYEDYLAPTDFSAGLVSAKHGAANSEHMYVYDTSEQQDAVTKSIVNARQFNIIIDGKPVKSSTKLNESELDSYFGKTVQFSILPGTKSGTNSECQSEIYVPKKIVILSPDISQIDYHSPLCYYKNFVLRWNRDENNQNGVIIAIEWNGNMVYGDCANNTYVRHIDCVPDTGECVLNDDLFENIPDTALCNLYVARGDVENVLINEYSYKLSGITFETLQFILVREVETK